MAFIPWQATVTNDAGNIVPSPVVTVRNAADNTLATIYNLAGVSVANPITGGTDGFVQFQVSPGRYTIEGAKDGSVTQVWEWEAKDQGGFASVALFNAAVTAGYTAPDGTVVSAGPVQFQADSSASVSGLPVGWLPFGDVYPDHWADNTTPETTDMTSAIQSAMNFVSERNDASGGDVKFFGVSYGHTGLTMKSRVFLRGAGRGATILYLMNAVNGNSLTIPAGCEVFGWSGLTFNGNRQNNTIGNGIHFDEALSGGSFGSEFFREAAVASRSYKHCIAEDFAVGYCAGNNINMNTKNFKVFFDNFSSVRAFDDGLYVRSSDCVFSNFYVERNGRTGIDAGGSNNKYIAGKAIWSGYLDNTTANIFVSGGDHIFVAVEAQDGYSDGWSIGGTDHVLTGCSGNRNGYLADGSEDQSSKIHTDMRIRSNASGVRIDAKSYTYATAVGFDGLWTTQWPYYFDAFAQGQVDAFNLDYDPATYNAAPNVHVAAILVSNLMTLHASKSGSGDVLLDISPISPDGSGVQTIRMFRQSDATTGARLDVHVPGTASVNHRLDGGAAGATLCGQSGDATIGNGAWNGQRLRLGPNYLWVDATGDLRIKSSAPTSDTDGTVVGTQS